MKKKCILSALLIFSIVAIYGQTPEKKLYTATRISSPPTINGVLDDAAWQSGIWLDDFTQYEPFSGRPASQRTEFNILFDDNYL